ncbi:hypothetical protein COU13_00735 [Candidatus Kaiserbacteria bacterium CG10_big_fil_rev_8_21_14_0_10_43_70]|uniref:Uncharacterized protein n=1 Tax=Candidatus Kaiserbacteria bacterium CG10_big_fil_rev_8_21_14_0_10_43_70 TaxID=1974605 RepID=A0A2H0ULC7_9BACT|nr:MAG: hypothetical protein COU13_00735 [Candidatus Kaiserbacteria bacterium CG10_big_fil_rev_8_21_14_0_10_43_70]
MQNQNTECVYGTAREKLQDLIILLRFSNKAPLDPEGKTEAHNTLKEIEALAERHIPDDHEICRRTIWHTRSEDTWQEVMAYLCYLDARLANKASVNNLEEALDATESAPSGAFPRTMH